MNKGYIFAGLAVLLAGWLVVSVLYTNQRIDPERPTAATPTPHSEPAKPTDPTALGNSGVK